jgi:hypothetical protein
MSQKLNPSEILEFIIEPSRVRIMSHRGTCLHDIPVRNIAEWVSAVKKAVHGWAKWKSSSHRRYDMPKSADLDMDEQ